jgi:hypothetical protein
MVAGAAQAELLQLVERGLEDVGAVAEALHAERALLADHPYPLARLLRRGDRTGVAVAEERVGKDARRRDLVARAALHLRHAEREPVAATRIAHRGDAVTEPQLVHVLGRRALLLAADVAVQVDQARQHVVAGEIELAAAGLQRRAILGLDRRAGAADQLDLGDAIALDHQVDRPEGGAAGAVDQDHAAQDQLRLRSIAFGARRRGRNRGERGRDPDRQQQEQCTHDFPERRCGRTMPA